MKALFIRSRAFSTLSLVHPITSPMLSAAVRGIV